MFIFYTEPIGIIINNYNLKYTDISDNNRYQSKKAIFTLLTDSLKRFIIINCCNNNHVL